MKKLNQHYRYSQDITPDRSSFDDQQTQRPSFSLTELYSHIFQQNLMNFRGVKAVNYCCKVLHLRCLQVSGYASNTA